MELNLYAAAVDLLLLAIFGITVWRGWRRGLVSAAAGLLSLVGALIISGMFSYLFYGILQRTIFDPFVSDIVGSLIENAAVTAEATAEAAAQAIASSLDGIRSCTDIFGITVPLDAESLTELLVGTDGGVITQSLTVQIAEPIAARLALWASHLLLFVIAYILLRFVFGVLNLVMRLPLLKEANSFLGGVGGLILGAGYAFITARLLAVIVGILVTQGTLPPEILGGTVFTFLTGSV